MSQARRCHTLKIESLAAGSFINLLIVSSEIATYHVNSIDYSKLKQSQLIYRFGNQTLENVIRLDNKNRMAETRILRRQIEVEELVISEIQVITRTEPKPSIILLLCPGLILKKHKRRSCRLLPKAPFLILKISD